MAGFGRGYVFGKADPKNKFAKPKGHVPKALNPEVRADEEAAEIHRRDNTVIVRKVRAPADPIAYDEVSRRLQARPRQ